MQKKLAIIRDVSTRLDSANIGYMLTGSMAMNYYAQSTITCDNARDIEIVVALLPADASRVVQLFSPDYYIVPEMVDNCITDTSGFHVFHIESEIKAGCSVLKQTEYRLIEFNRRQRVRIKDFETWIVSREDLILSKLRLFWAKDLSSELHLRDIKDLVSTGCDRAYIERWTWGRETTILWPQVTA